MTTHTMHSTRDQLRAVIQATEEAAERDKVRIDADALAVMADPDVLFVVAPIAGLERLDYTGLLAGRPTLDGQPLMYWHLSGARFATAKGVTRGSLAAGFYTVVANQTQGAARLVDAAGKTLATGGLTISVDPPPPVTTAAKVGVSGGVTSVKFGKNSVKVCGNVEVSVGPATVTVTACIDVHL